MFTAPLKESFSRTCRKLYSRDLQYTKKEVTYLQSHPETNTHAFGQEPASTFAGTRNSTPLMKPLQVHLHCSGRTEIHVQLKCNFSDSSSSLKVNIN
jgi:hypothetical protein